MLNIETNDKLRYIDATLSGFESLDLGKADYQKISQSIENYNWHGMIQKTSIDDIPVKLPSVLLRICDEYLPKRKPNISKKNNNEIPQAKKRKG